VLQMAVKRQDRWIFEVGILVDMPSCWLASIVKGEMIAYPPISPIHHLTEG
jgi:hypothetical protein